MVRARPGQAGLIIVMGRAGPGRELENVIGLAGWAKNIQTKTDMIGRAGPGRTGPGREF